MVVTLAGDGGPMIALLGHTDTVFPIGTAAARPFRREGDRCFGPGVADMKGGVLLAAAAIERLAAAPSRPFSEVRLLVCADEETRLRAPAVCDEAKGAAAALVFECARENGDLVSERKGAIWRTLRLHGRPAHAGADTHRGRSAVSALASFDQDAADNSKEANQRKAERLLAQMPVVVADHFRLSKGLQPVPARPDLGTAANFLHMLRDEESDPNEVKALDVSLTLYAEHEFNASTFTARVIVSTMADLHSAITGAIGALKGPLHGGANEKVMDVLIAAGWPAVTPT
jgi:acetylornithine deacetylase/succinyl-diaminopimelate desuccinylase-like protein